MTDDVELPPPQPVDATERTPTILVVDDEVLIRMSVSDFLQECGNKVLEAGTAAEAIKMLEANTIVIDLVFSDVRMPGQMDGFGLARWVREHRPGLPVILASGDSYKSDAARELCAKEAFFPKPYDLPTVLEQMRALIGFSNAKN